MKQLWTILLVLACAQASFGQPPDTLWTRTFGGPGDENVGRCDLEKTLDGALLLANMDSMVKIDLWGNVLWARATNNGAFAVKNASGGGYVLAGRRLTPWNIARGFKVDLNGIIVWDQIWDIGCWQQLLLDVVEADNGDFVFAGRTDCAGTPYNNFYVVRTSSDGGLLWQVSYPASSYGAARLCKTNDGGFLIVGTEMIYGSPPAGMHLHRIDSIGGTVWERDYSAGSTSTGEAILACGDGTYVVAGMNSDQGAGGQDMWLLKINGAGDTLWSRIYGGSANDVAHDVKMTSDGGFVIVGSTESYGAGGKDIYVVRTDAAGNLIWSQTYGGSADDEAHAVQVLPDRSFAISGNTWSFGAGGMDNYLVKTGPEGPNVGYVTLISSGPPDWGYRLHHVSGSLSRLVFTNFCSGTIGSVGGNAAAVGWAVANYSDSIVFTTSTPLTSGMIDTFWLSHPTCSDHVTWTAGDSSGTIEGPLPVELTTFEAIAGEGQVTLRWRTESELDNNHFVLYKRKVGEDIFRKLTEIPGHGTTTEPHDYEFVDRFVQNSVTYEYQISDVDITGREIIHEQIVSATPSRTIAPLDFALCPNYPNPFNPTTTIRYDVKETGIVSLKLFDLLGREVATLVYSSVPAGSYSIDWDAGHLPSGLYLCRMEAERFVETRKMVLLK